MGKTFKAGNVLWVISFIISLLCAVGLLFFMLQEKASRIELEQQLSELQNAKKATEIKLDRAQLELMQLKEKAQVLAKQVEQEKKSYQAAIEDVDKKKAQLKELEANLASEKKQRLSLANALAQLREKQESLQEQLKQAKQQMQGPHRPSAASAPRSGVELKKIVVKPKKELSGKVLVVNKEFHFVVIDLGKKDEVGVGDEFVVYRNSQDIGKVKVEKAYEAMCTASILPGSQEEKINEESIVESF